MPSRRRRGVSAITATVAFVVVVVVAVGANLASDRYRWDWGVAGEWVGGVGGVAAFAAALGIASVEHGRYRAAIERDERATDVRQRQRASLVILVVEERLGAGTRDDPVGPLEGWTLWVRNDSDAPIYGVLVAVNYLVDSDAAKATPEQIASERGPRHRFESWGRADVATAS